MQVHTTKLPKWAEWTLAELVGYGMGFDAENAVQGHLELLEEKVVGWSCRVPILA
jgi:hypothetical protein